MILAPDEPVVPEKARVMAFAGSVVFEVGGVFAAGKEQDREQQE